MYFIVSNKSYFRRIGLFRKSSKIINCTAIIFVTYRVRTCDLYNVSIYLEVMGQDIRKNYNICTTDNFMHIKLVLQFHLCIM
jgi:hypothetical protein